MRKTIHIYTTRTQSLNSVNGVLQLAHKWQIFLRAQTRDNVSARTVQLVSLMCVIFGSQRFSYVMCEYTQRMPLTHTHTHTKHTEIWRNVVGTPDQKLDGIWYFYLLFFSFLSVTVLLSSDELRITSLVGLIENQSQAHKPKQILRNTRSLVE